MNLGDSFIQAAQVDLDNTMTKKLETKLNCCSKQKKIKFFNVGTSGCNPEVQRKFLEKNISKFDLDFLFLFTYIGNDILTLSKIENQINKASTIELIFNSFIINARRLSKLINYIWKRTSNGESEWNGPFGRPCQPFDGKPIEITGNLFCKEYNQHIENAYKDYYTELYRINQICQNNSIKLCVYIIPTKEQVEPLKLKEVIDYFEIEQNMLGIYKPQNRIKKFLLKNNICHFDLIDTLSFASKIKDTYFGFDSHWNMYGNDVVAEYVFNNSRFMILK